MNKQIDNILAKSKTLAIIGHINPDGDCFGSMSAVNDYAKEKYGCIVHCFAECETIAEEFEPFAKDLIFNQQSLGKYDTCICVDVADIRRLGIYTNIFNNSNNTICIDHHTTNVGFAQLNFINPISSNCEFIYNMLKQNNFNIQKSTAGKIFAGILTDTNNLSTDTVTIETHLAVIDLINKGVNANKISKFFLSSNSMPQYKLLTLAMQSAKFYNDNTIMAMQITKEQLDETGGTQEDLNPIINQAFCMKHAKCAFLLTPRQNQTHVSFRARGEIDVSLLAQHFGGGGHKSAAAFTTPDFSAKDFDFIIQTLSHAINNLPVENEKLF